MKVTVITGSRADYGLLEWPIKTLREDNHFQVSVFNICKCGFDGAFKKCADAFIDDRPDMILVLGDRYEILAAVTAAHLLRVPIAHIGGGDVTEGSYDDAMRDCISRMATVHFVTSTSSMARLSHMGYRNVHLVGNPGIDYIRHADWKRERPIQEPYVVVAYYPETIDGTIEWDKVLSVVGDRRAIAIMPNQDIGSHNLTSQMMTSQKSRVNLSVWDSKPHAEFLNLLAHCEEFIGNSSAMLYEAPELGIQTRMIGKRQRGRTIPMGDGNASLRMVNILRYASL